MKWFAIVSPFYTLAGIMSALFAHTSVNDDFLLGDIPHGEFSGM